MTKLQAVGCMYKSTMLPAILYLISLFQIQAYGNQLSPVSRFKEQPTADPKGG